MNAVNALAESLGRNVRRYRTLRGLSGLELAQRSGIARATLSALEAGRGNPTLDTLVAVAEVLGIDVVELMECRPHAMTIERAAKALVADDGAARLLHQFREGPCSIDVYAFALVAGDSLVSAAHGSGVLEHILIQTGQLELELNPGETRSRPTLLDPGDYVSFTADVPHVYTAVAGHLQATLIMHYPTGSPAPSPVEGVDSSTLAHDKPAAPTASTTHRLAD